MAISHSGLETAAQQCFGKAASGLTVIERNVLHHLLHREAIAEEAPHSSEGTPITLGERLADRVARFGGWWPFIALFALFSALGCAE